MMANKKKVTKDRLISLFMDFVLENNHQPKSVFSFAKINNFEESEFYKFYASFEILEAAIFSDFFHLTISLLEKSEDYESFDAKNKILSFYFTFFEILNANRSYVVYSLENSKNDFKKLKNLKQLRSNFINYIKEIGIEKLDLKQEKLDKIQDKTIEETSWLHLLVTIKFWLDDTSPSFEKTDVFIEKSIHAKFDLMDIKSLKSIMDFGKFILKEKVYINL